MTRCHRGLSLLLAFACLSCGDDATAPIEAPVEPLCGQEGAVRLLPLDPEQRIHDAVLEPAVRGEIVGERFVFEVEYREGLDTPVVVTQLWSVGLCGEDPLLLADEIGGSRRLMRFEHWPGQPFVCDSESQTVVAVDPTGVHEGQPTFAAGRCRVLETEAGLLAVLGDEDVGQLVLQPWPTDPLTETAEQIVVHDAVTVREFPGTQVDFVEHALSVQGQELLAINADDELISIDLQDFSSAVLATGVREFFWGETGRWVVWQDIEVTSMPVNRALGPVYLLDRQTGESVLIGDTGLEYVGPTSVRFDALGLIYLGDSFEQYYLTLPDLDLVDDIPYVPYQVIDEYRGLMGSPLMIYDAQTKSITPLLSEVYIRAQYLADGVDLLRELGGELVHVSYDTAEPETLASHAYPHWQHTADDRILTIASRNESTQAGPLVVVDTGTLEAAQIEANVHFASITAYETPEVLMVSYAVVDADPERHGVWLRGLAR